MKIRLKNKSQGALLMAIMAMSCGTVNAELGDRASWMRGALGLMWQPTSFDWELLEANEDWLSIEPFLEQMDAIDTLDYVQLKLGDASVKSASHTSPSAVIENFMGDVIIVPRAASGFDPFGDWLKACKARGLRTQVYINSNCLVYGDATIAQRWKDYCNSKRSIRNFINSQSYHKDSDFPDRQYMFCYAEFVIKDYSNRYGNLIDCWIFDKARKISDNGDVVNTDDIGQQKLFEAWANAARSGNSNAAVAFNHGVGSAKNPFNGSTQVGDYTFGHPFGGTNNPTATTSIYNRNYSFCQIMDQTNGFVYSDDNKDWNDRVMGHSFPKMSTSAWNGGNTPALTNKQFLEWNQVGLSGGAITWGLPIVHSDCNKPHKRPVLVGKDWAIDQLKYMNERITVSKAKFVQFRKRNAFNYCLDGGSGGTNGQNVGLYSYVDNHKNLTWEEIDRGNGFYSYKKKGTNFCIDGGNGGNKGQNVLLWKENSTNFNQHWQKISTGDGTYQLRKRNSTTYAIDGNNGGSNSQNVDLRRSSVGSQNLHWFIEYK